MKKEKDDKCKDITTENSKKSLDAKKQKKQSIIGLSICVTISAVLGIGIGIFLNSLSSNERRDFDETLYKDDFTVIKEKYQKALDDDIEDFSEVLTPVEMMQISYDLFNDTNFIVECNGINSNGYSGDQIVTSMMSHWNGKIYAESISYGKMVKTGTRYFLEEGADQIVYYSADTKTFNVNEEDELVYVQYSDVKNYMSAKDYEDKFGSALGTVTPLLISSKTVKSGTTPTCAKDDNGYHIVIELSDDATERYKTQIIGTDSKVTNVTHFSSLKIDCVLDEKLRLIDFNIYEQYEVVALKIIMTQCNSHLDYRYYYEDDGLKESWIPTSTESYLLLKGAR